MGLAPAAVFVVSLGCCRRAVQALVVVAQVCPSCSADAVRIVGAAPSCAVVEGALVVGVELSREGSGLHGVRVREVIDVIRGSRVRILELLLLVRLQLLVRPRRQAPLAQRHEHVVGHVVVASLAVRVVVGTGLSAKGASLVIVLHAHDNGIPAPQPVVYFRYILERL